MFSLLIRKLGSWPAEEAADLALRGIARAAGVTDEDLVKRLQAGEAGAPAGAEAAYARLWTLRVCKLVVLACQRYWAWGATDLFRLRITSTIGYLRLEAECVGLLKLFENDDPLAERWSRIKTQDEGTAFFRETQPRLKTVLRTFDLDTAYNIASNSAQHVRMAGIVRGLSSGDGELALPDQDFDSDDPYSYHLAVAHYHRIQARILRALGGVLPDVADDNWRSEIKRFSENSDSMWAALEQRYAGQTQPDVNPEDAEPT